MATMETLRALAESAPDNFGWLCGTTALRVLRLLTAILPDLDIRVLPERKDSVAHLSVTILVTDVQLLILLYVIPKMFAGAL